MIPHAPITYIFWAVIGAGFVFLLAVQPPQPACEPVELLRFVSQKPEIHVVSETTYGRGTNDWLQQFDSPEPVVTQEEDEPVHHYRRRRYGRR